MARVTTCSFHADNSWKEFPLIQTRNTHRHQPNPLQVANDATSGTLGGPRYQINGRHTVSQPLVLKILRSTGSFSSYMVSYPVNTALLVRTRGIVMVEQTRDTSVCCLTMVMAKQTSWRRYLQREFCCNRTHRVTLLAVAT